jgi:hypothetical protein
MLLPTAFGGAWAYRALVRFNRVYACRNDPDQDLARARGWALNRLHLELLGAAKIAHTHLRANANQSRAAVMGALGITTWTPERAGDA